MIDWQTFGKHLVHVDGDTVHAIWQGDVELAEVEQIFTLYAEVHNQCGRVFFLSDMRRSGVPPAPVRRWIAQWLRHERKLDGACAYGANPIIRAAFTMLLRGSMLVGKFYFPFDILGTESEARDWVNQLRQELLSKPRCSSTVRLAP